MTRIRVSSELEDARQTVLQSLRHYRSMVANYQACKELYDQLFPSSTQMLTDMPKAPTESYEPERYASRRLDLRARMEDSLDEMIDEYQQIEIMVRSVSGDYNTVLTRRYMLNESWEVIADKMHCERTTVWRWHNAAVMKMANEKLQHRAT